MKTKTVLFAIMAICLLVAGCGGGGEGETDRSTSDTPVAVEPIEKETPEVEPEAVAEPAIVEEPVVVEEPEVMEEPIVVLPPPQDDETATVEPADPEDFGMEVAEDDPLDRPPAGAEPPGDEPLMEDKPEVIAVISEACNDWDFFRAGETLQYVYENNVWHKLDITDYEQCLLRGVHGKDKRYGWRWSWPVVEDEDRRGDVKTFPNVFYGHHPFYETTTDDALPVRVGDITEFDVTYDISLEASGTYNMAFQLWVTNGPMPTPETRTHEIMIWVAHNFLPMGDDHPQYFVEEVEIDGAWYDLYLRHDFVSGEKLGNPLAHKFAAFVLQGEQLAGSLDIAKFLGHLVEIAHLSEDVYVAHLALGNEIIDGTGTVWVNDYHVSLPGQAEVVVPSAVRGDVRVGSRFVNETTLPGGDVILLTYTVTERIRHRGRAVYVVEESFDGSPTYNSFYFDVQTNNQVARLSDGEIYDEFVPHDGRIQYPLEVGRVYRGPHYYISNEVEGDWWFEWEIQAVEPFDIGAETYEAYRIATIGSKDGDLHPGDVFWVADIDGRALTVRGDFYSYEAGGRIQTRLVEFYFAP